MPYYIDFKVTTVVQHCPLTIICVCIHTTG